MKKLLTAVLLMASIGANGATKQEILSETVWMESCATGFPESQKYREYSDKALAMYKKHVSEHGLNVFLIKSIIKVSDSIEKLQPHWVDKCNSHTAAIDRIESEL
ncbi:MAG: hypothetical protein ACPG5Z_16320 [Pseudoalteromonas sp.]